MSKDAVPADNTPATYKNPIDDLAHVLPAGLTNEESEFIYNAEILGMPARVAAKRAGLPSAKIVAPHIVQSRDIVRRAVRSTLNISKQDIVNGYQEAVWMAKQQGDALTMMIGWEKTAKILGLEQPTRVDINIHASVEVLQRNARDLSDNELIESLGAGNVIDAEFYEVKPNGEA